MQPHPHRRPVCPWRCLTFAVLATSSLACFTRQRNGGENTPAAPLVAASEAGSSAGELPPRPFEDRSTFVALDLQTYKVRLRDDMVWNAAIAVLMRNYNLNIVDRSSGVITTEWDSFYLNRQVYRNKVSVRVAKTAYRTCQLIITNNTEVLRDGSQASPGVLGPVWLPSEDVAGESARLVRNIATYLEEAPPRLPQTQLSKAASSEKAERTYRLD